MAALRWDGRVASQRRVDRRCDTGVFGHERSALHGRSDDRGFLTHTVMLTQTSELGVTSFPHEGTLWFAFRIESQDSGWGSTPQAPYDDWLTAEFRSTDGKLVRSLLRTGNSARYRGDGLPGPLPLSHAAS